MIAMFSPIALAWACTRTLSVNLPHRAEDQKIRPRAKAIKSRAKFAGNARFSDLFVDIRYLNKSP